MSGAPALPAQPVLRRRPGPSRRGAATVRRLRRDLALALGLGLLLSLFVDLAILVVPIYDMQLYDRVIQSHNMDSLVLLSAACLVGLVLYGVVDYLRSAVLVLLSDRVARRLYLPVLAAAVRRGAEGDAVAGAEALRDLNELRAFLASGAVATPLDALCAPLLLAVLFLLHPAYGFLGLCGLSSLLLLGLAAEALGRPGVVAAGARRAAVAATLASRLRETVLSEGMGMLPAIARDWFRGQRAALLELGRVSARAEALAGLARLLRLLLQAGVMGMGALMILAHMTTPGSLMGANLLLNKLLNPFDHLVESWRHWSLAHAAWRRLAAVLPDGTASGRAAPEDAVAPVREAAPAGLEVRGLGFAAGGRTLLHEVGFAVPPGMALGITGPNGGGKSTLLRLLAGVTAPAAGEVLLDGVPVAEASARLGFLPQSTALLDGSVADNVSRFAELGPACTAATVLACRRAGVHELIGRLRHGYDAPAGAAAAGLSGGQRQRIGLARALFASPRLLVLDEPDASLDGEGEAALLRAVSEARREGAVVVVVTHRPALLAAMDLRLELREGRVASFGPMARPTGPVPRPASGPVAAPRPAVASAPPAILLPSRSRLA